MVVGIEGWGEPVPKPSEDLGRENEGDIERNGGCGHGAPLTFGTPVNEVGLGERKGKPLGGGEELEASKGLLQESDIGAVRRGSDGDSTIVDLRDHYPVRD